MDAMSATLKWPLLVRKSQQRRSMPSVPYFCQFYDWMLRVRDQYRAPVGGRAGGQATSMSCRGFRVVLVTDAFFRVRLNAVCGCKYVETWLFRLMGSCHYCADVVVIECSVHKA